jgi:hypothetical protein
MWWGNWTGKLGTLPGVVSTGVCGLPRARVSAKPEPPKSDMIIPGTRILDMKHPVKQKYLHHDDYPGLQPSATDGDIDIKQVLRTIKQLQESKMRPINVGV